MPRPGLDLHSILPESKVAGRNKSLTGKRKKLWFDFSGVIGNWSHRAVPRSGQTGKVMVLVKFESAPQAGGINYLYLDMISHKTCPEHLVPSSTVRASVNSRLPPRSLPLGPPESNLFVAREPGEPPSSAKMTPSTSGVVNPAPIIHWPQIASFQVFQYAAHAKPSTMKADDACYLDCTSFDNHFYVLLPLLQPSTADM